MGLRALPELVARHEGSDGPRSGDSRLLQGERRACKGLIRAVAAGAGLGGVADRRGQPQGGFPDREWRTDPRAQPVGDGIANGKARGGDRMQHHAEGGGSKAPPRDRRRAGPRAAERGIRREHPSRFRRPAAVQPWPSHRFPGRNMRSPCQASPRFGPAWPASVPRSAVGVGAGAIRLAWAAAEFGPTTGFMSTSRQGRTMAATRTRSGLPAAWAPSTRIGNSATTSTRWRAPRKTRLQRSNASRAALPMWCPRACHPADRRKPLLRGLDAELPAKG
jgi:hypothetical protein